MEGDLFIKPLRIRHLNIKAHQGPSIGDLVQIKDSTARGKWKIGHRIEIIKR